MYMGNKYEFRIMSINSVKLLCFESIDGAIERDIEKVWFEIIIYNHFMRVWNRCWRIFSEYIIGGQGFLQKNMYQMQICPSICWYNHLLFSCIFLYSCVLSPKNSCFCPPKYPRDKKGTKKYVPRVSGAQTRDKIVFFVLC